MFFYGEKKSSKNKFDPKNHLAMNKSLLYLSLLLFFIAVFIKKNCLKEANKSSNNFFGGKPYTHISNKQK